MNYRKDIGEKMDELEKLLKQHFPELKLQAMQDRSKEKTISVFHKFSSYFYLTQEQATNPDIENLKIEIIKMLAEEIRFIAANIELLAEK